MTAINFPAAPATGATHTEAGITWTFDGTVWDATGVGYVSKAGDTMTGNLTVPSLNGGQLAGFRNILINGNLKINQRGVTIAAAAVGAYGPDRWKKVDATNMTQIIEDLNVVHGAKYTLSWKGGTPQVLTAPATGHWTLPNIPITATEIQLELGEVATPFERRSYGQELALCQRYFCKSIPQGVAVGNNTTGMDDRGAIGTCFLSGQIQSNTILFPVTMRATPTWTLWRTTTTPTNNTWTFFNGSAWADISNLGVTGNDSKFQVTGSAAGGSNGSSYILSGHWSASIEL